ncbi:protocatechuate 3,4-dioxygenase subunit alpha [Paraburkholderia caballeronis]|uniref:Protocatechuate 3,4-dioxygenase, alpha subunit n=1 Tax=Paraburkholderia caballeronis TaxID=416943 RepID=A0A1H7NVR5_9BURK|nr:protocatechuate 3,4-dioxygenase subunit alpha [Paraburkholderia caballeronis]PXW25527.1 protocatechuate 3,4-dioxygenase alpha subunit [Paraburkholderia caballeronis]PXX01134.1 protocatechuate 3,4-dioxygenase alpha subunit [Paraburkholderia caballeronis]RAJ99513.1 protocatechuate 3,4-dioxygenase alpha subunit [Paraburkholderia caballeronis]SEE33685.1 protocatechuate 3,4-dioxygenase, alpha subunit [Paraburkholderia caballeronis]SEL27105.1 protocatechuate 3,4-dioxygenase, alpha subunit [Parabu
MAFKETPSQTVGPYFAYGLCPQQYDFDLKSLFTPDIATPDAAGEHITLIGRVFDGDGNAVHDAMLEFSQVDSEGRYPSTRAQIDETGFRGFGRAGTGTDPKQRFVVRTVKPARANPAEAPHLNVIVTMRGMLTHTFTRIYFDDEAAANDADPVLSAVPADRRATLIAKRDEQAGNIVYRFDIHMQGERETVFFDL